MEIKKIVSESMGQNCYLIKNGGKGILIDPGEDTAKIMSESESVDVSCILLTHCHYDHVWSLNDLGKRVMCSEKCAENMTKPEITLCPAEILPRKKGEIIREESFKVDEIEITPIYTPGHTDGSMCFLIDGNLFSGDTLFCGSVGRWDLPTGDFASLSRSIKKLYTLPPKTAVYPGHGSSTTIEDEMKYGYFRAE